MKIAILNSNIFPVPAAKGGAVETLIESFIKYVNEDKSVKLTVFSLYDEKAFVEAKKYPNVNFKWIKRPLFVDVLDRKITSFIRFIKGDKDLWQKNYIWQVLSKNIIRKNLLKEDYDRVLIENAIYLCELFYDKKLEDKYADKVYFHTHNTHFRRVKKSGAFKRVISISNFLIENTKKCFGNDIDIRVVYNGVNINLFESEVSKEEKMKLKSLNNIPEDAPVVVFVGRIMPKKGVIELLKAFLQIRNSSAHLILVGSSSFGMSNKTAYENEVAKIVRDSCRIHATGFVANEQIFKYYALADVAVLPSIWEEPLGLTMIEAQLSNVPLITTDRGGIPETTSKENSIVLDIDDKFIEKLTMSIDEVLDNQKLWKEKAELARGKVRKRFNEKTYYENMKCAVDMDKH